MPRWIRQFAFLVLPAFAVAACLHAGADEAARPKLDSLFSPLASGRTPGLAVLVQRNGRVWFRKGYGVRDRRTLAGIDEGTNFRLASCTKQFTAMAIMLLAHDGKLRYGDSIGSVFPDFPDYGRAITILQLLTHTSGLPDYEDLMTAAEKSGRAVWTATHQIQDDEVLGLLKGATQRKFAPGTSWSYSNSGYVVLGLVVAQISGKPFGRFLHDRIFEPLQMRSTLAYVKGQNTVQRRAYGHKRDRDEFVEADQSSTSATLGDGGVYSNLQDLARWDDALRNGTLVSREEMKAGLTEVRLAGGSQPRWPLEPGDDNLNPGQPVSYGFGWFVDPYKGHARMWHFGATSGFRAAIERFTDEDLTIIILCNRTDLDPAALALQAADTLHGGD